MHTKRRLTEAERAERRAQDRELAIRAVAQLRTSAGWQAWLRVRARTGLRRYSVGNQLLIALQDPAATRVAGFRAWLALGYCVRKGESSRIRIWARCEPSKKKLQAWRDAGAIASERPRPFYRLEAVFDRAQVEPLPPPATPCPLDPPIAPITGETLAWAMPELERFAAEIDVSVERIPMAPGVDGLYGPNERHTAINSAMAINQQVAALVHELGHALVRIDHQDDDPELDYATEELVAESVAYTVCGFLGLNTAANSVPYLAVWSEATAEDAFERIAGLIDRLARRVEDALDPRGVTLGEPASTSVSA
ncbi:antirestriction protein ArdC [Solirubrobacter pauli]|uniref:Antirestriction protein ArdC n=1 Tax=Solirubrobacter pauli TaxID=166793 RepID=A0A660LD52_9ACTN|nr:ArdC-like ssDNA-binding domain-containing protein [Solirubrobacter pauli]RKQ92977.1 antirestriction protein ArdC [Solirubrobacter pauli]